MRIDRNALTKSRIRRNWQKLAVEGPLFNVTPTGVIDGTNDTFTLPSNPLDGSLMLFVTGVLQLEGTDFNVASNVITFTGGSIPTGGAWIRATYDR